MGPPALVDQRETVDRFPRCGPLICSFDFPAQPAVFLTVLESRTQKIFGADARRLDGQFRLRAAVRLEEVGRVRPGYCAETIPFRRAAEFDLSLGRDSLDVTMCQNREHRVFGNR